MAGQADMPSEPGQFWRRFSVEIPLEDQREGENFVSVIFEKEFAHPELENWYASAFLRSIRIREPDD